MRIGVVGVGGVGGLLSGLLSRAGHEVSVIARGEALRAIRKSGIRIDSPLGTFAAKVEAASSPEQLAPVDVVLLAVKTWQVSEATKTIGSFLREGGYVVPLQNGVEAMDQAASVLGEDRVVGGLCRMLSAIAEPGAIKHVGAAPSVTLGAWSRPIEGRIDPLVQALDGAGIRVDIANDFPAALWEKFLFIASFGGVGALSRSTAGEIRRIPETRRLLSDAFEEIRAVAAAKGIKLAPDVVTKTLAFVDSLPEAATASLQRDIVARRPSELDSLSGAVARAGAAFGVSVPVHATIHAALLPNETASRAGPSA
jgi:2-dehydropantoate 2-reductase